MKPNYVEAYPVLNVLKCTAAERHSPDKASKKARKPRPDLCLFINESGLRLGDLVVLGRFSTAVVISFCIHGPYFSGDDADVRLPLSDTPSGIHEERRCFVCDGCQSQVINLVFDGVWLCRKCHGLVHRSQVLAKGVAEYEEMLLLRGKFGKGRQHRMRNTTFAANRLRLNELEAKYARRFLSASQQHSRLIVPHWSALADFEDEVFSRIKRGAGTFRPDAE